MDVEKGNEGSAASSAYRSSAYDERFYLDGTVRGLAHGHIRDRSLNKPNGKRAKGGAGREVQRRKDQFG